MATTAEAAAHLFLTVARFQDLLAQGVISRSKSRGGYKLDKVREQYIRHIRKGAAGHGKNADGLAQARAELAREQTVGVALKNAIARGEYAPIAMMQQALATRLTAFRERALAIPGKSAAECEMRPREAIETLLRAEIHDLLDGLSRPIVGGGDGMPAGDREGD